jgi:hypothetical protein
MAELEQFLGDFADDAAVDAWIAGKGWTHQAMWMYYDTTLTALKAWDGVAWYIVVSSGGP